MYNVYQNKKIEITFYLECGFVQVEKQEIANFNKTLNHSNKYVKYAWARIIDFYVGSCHALYLPVIDKIKTGLQYVYWFSHNLHIYKKKTFLKQTTNEIQG